MAEDGFKNLIYGLILFVVFTTLILTVAIDFGNEYGKSSNEIGNGSLSKIKFQDSAENVTDSTSAFRTRFESGGVDDIDDATGIFSILTDFVNLIVTPFALIGSIVENVFGVSSWIINTILGILGLGLILGIWRVLRTGS
tara:strand:+ start:25 stop:444 length:420 start_codon:yes stop_codon:yes gene_type:complete